MRATTKKFFLLMSENADARKNLSFRLFKDRGALDQKPSRMIINFKKKFAVSPP